MDGAREAEGDGRGAAPRDTATARAAFFWLRLGLLLGLAGAFWGSGAAAWLAGRVAGGGGTWRYGVFVALCVATYEALLFPVARWAEATLGDSRGEFGAWLRGYAFAVAVEVGAVTAAALAGRWLWLAMGRWWWAGATAGYAVLSPDMWPVALWAWRDRMTEAAPPEWLARANAALRRAGRREAGGVAVYDEPRRSGLREMHFLYRGGGAPTLVVRRDVWESDGGDALAFGAVWEGARRRSRRWGRLGCVGIAAAVLWGAGAGAADTAGGIGSAAAFPAMAVWLFALSTVGGVVRNAFSKWADARADREACAALGGGAEMAAWAEAVERREGGGRRPWWAAALQRERGARERAKAAGAVSGEAGRTEERE